VNRWRFNKDYMSHLHELPIEEVRKLLPYGRDAVEFERWLGAATVAAVILIVLGVVTHTPPVYVIASLACVGFIAVGTIGGEIKFRHFLRLTAEAIDKHLNRTQP
jgi:hypothetical protein